MKSIRTLKRHLRARLEKREIICGKISKTLGERELSVTTRAGIFTQTDIKHLAEHGFTFWGMATKTGTIWLRY